MCPAHSSEGCPFNLGALAHRAWNPPPSSLAEERTPRAVFICSLRAPRLALVRQPGSVRRRAIPDARARFGLSALHRRYPVPPSGEVSVLGGCGRKARSQFAAYLMWLHDRVDD